MTALSFPIRPTVVPSAPAAGAAGAPSAAALPLRGRRVLVVEDDPIVQAFSAGALRAAGAEVETVGRGDDALAMIGRAAYDLVYLDLDLPGLDGMSVLAALPGVGAEARVVVVTSEEAAGVAVEAMKRGAADYLTKPVEAEALVNAGVLVLDRPALRRIPTAPAVRTARARIVGDSPVVRRLLDQVERVAPTRAPVLVAGESGTGKELVARLVHDLSPRADAPFIAVRCSAVGEAALELELFGQRSASGAATDGRGLIEEAHGGTLFLDEVAGLTPALQARLLRALQERQVRRTGGGAAALVDVRIVAASTPDLATEVAAGRFRQDLYFRLNVVPLALPPLRDRREDVPALVAHFREQLAAERGAPLPPFDAEAVARMTAHDWPGNVRELENAVARAAILHADARTLPFELPPAPGRGAPTGSLLAQANDAGWDLARLEREYILAVLEGTRGHQSRAAERLGIDRRTLYRKLREYGVR